MTVDVDEAKPSAFEIAKTRELKQWNAHAVAGALEGYEGPPPPRMPQELVKWWALELGNYQEAREYRSIISYLCITWPVVVVALGMIWAAV